MNESHTEQAQALESRMDVYKAENQRLQRDKAALQADVTELRSALRMIASDIDGFVSGDLDGNEQGWEALSRRAQSAIVSSYHLHNYQQTAVENYNRTEADNATE